MVSVADLCVDLVSSGTQAADHLLADLVCWLTRAVESHLLAGDVSTDPLDGPLLAGMNQHNLVPNILTYNSAHCDCEQDAQWQVAVALFAGMTQRTLGSDTNTYNSAINDCGKGTKWQKALALRVGTG